MFDMDELYGPFKRDVNWAEKELLIQRLKKEIDCLSKELDLYQKWCARPKVLKGVIHHKAVPRDSQCLYGSKAYDQYIYE